MSDDIGPGDCVEARSALFVPSAWTARGDTYDIAAGARTVVAGLSPLSKTHCGACNKLNVRGLLLTDYPLMPFVSWCPCEWRKVGGSKADTLKLFADYTRRRDADAIKTVVESLP